MSNQELILHEPDGEIQIGKKYFPVLPKEQPTYNCRGEKIPNKEEGGLIKLVA